uniref:Uncharacterized protein n=1 Tax=Oryzias melastigma TaxID=30732 RepID=A0A3B3B8R4_ORYME
MKIQNKKRFLLRPQANTNTFSAKLAARGSSDQPPPARAQQMRGCLCCEVVQMAKKRSFFNIQMSYGGTGAYGLVRNLHVSEGTCCSPAVLTFADLCVFLHSVVL